MTSYAKNYLTQQEICYQKQIISSNGTRYQIVRALPFHYFQTVLANFETEKEASCITTVIFIMKIYIKILPKIILNVDFIPFGMGLLVQS